MLEGFPGGPVVAASFMGRTARKVPLPGGWQSPKPRLLQLRTDR